ncbi:MAG: hypothetical protein Q9219_005661 [cf. Caloplaca sp. 3 TL-2023]
MPGPLLAVSTSEKPSRQPPRSQRRPHPLLALLCCAGPADSEIRHTAQVVRQHEASSPAIMHARSPRTPDSVRHNTNSGIQDRRPRSSAVRPVLAEKSPNLSNRPSLPRDPSSQTEGLLAWIPKFLPPQTTSQLLAELAKPISDHDEAGYIYMFWLTTAINLDATSLLTPSPLPSPRTRKVSSGSASNIPFSHTTGDPSSSTVMLKIGRASNVQRRMNEWTRQCGFNLSLIRFYPYVQSTPQGSPSARAPSTTQGSSAEPRKVPHAHKVERLIHLELAEKRMKRECEACGKEHREWFKVNGDRQGVKAVDEAIRRWVRWAETTASAPGRRMQY